MQFGRPIIGITGGIGSGKSFVARLFGEAGCFVTHSDDLARAALSEPAVIQKLRQWWGPGVLRDDGLPDRAAIAVRVFSDASQRVRLEALIHPLVDAARDQQMATAATDPRLRAFVWDTPLLIETGLDRACDALVFVDAPPDVRQRRVIETRRWTAGELERREKTQFPLDKKRMLADYVIRNAPDASDAREQVAVALSRIIAASVARSQPAGAGVGRPNGG